MPQITTQPTSTSDIWGTSVTQGFRIGPSAENEGAYPAGEYAPTSAIRYQLDQWGPGVYTGGLFTYRILPAPVDSITIATTTPGHSNRDNVVAQFAMSTTLLEQSLPLSGAVTSPRATQKITVNGVDKLIFDYPRTINLYTDNAQTATIGVQVYGSDLYGQPMTEVITIVGPGTTTGSVTIQPGLKAFAQVDAVYIASQDGAVTTNNFAIGTSNTFGLPFRLDQACHVVAYSQGDLALQDLSVGYTEASWSWPQTFGLIQDTPAGTITPYQISGPAQLNAGDSTTATATTGDVRGTVYPDITSQWTDVQAPTTSNAGFFEIIVTGPLISSPTPTNNWINADFPYITVTYYVAGADMYQNQILAQRDAAKALVADPSIFDGMWTNLSPTRDQDGAKGVPQYWEAPGSA